MTRVLERVIESIRNGCSLNAAALEVGLSPAVILRSILRSDALAQEYVDAYRIAEEALLDEAACLEYQLSPVETSTGEAKDIRKRRDLLLSRAATKHRYAANAERTAERHYTARMEREIERDQREDLKVRERALIEQKKKNEQKAKEGRLREISALSAFPLSPEPTREMRSNADNARKRIADALTRQAIEALQNQGYHGEGINIQNLDFLIPPYFIGSQK